VICEPLREAIGRSAVRWRACSAVDLGETVLRELLIRHRNQQESVDDVILGPGYPNSDAPAVGRWPR